jgi:hypothetical protein
MGGYIGERFDTVTVGECFHCLDTYRQVGTCMIGHKGNYVSAWLDSGHILASTCRCMHD